MKYVKRGMVFAFCSIILSACSSNINSVDENNDGIDDNLKESIDTSRESFKEIGDIISNTDLSKDITSTQKEFILELVDDYSGFLNNIEYGVSTEIDQQLNEVFTQKIDMEKDLLKKIEQVVNSGDSELEKEISDLNLEILTDNLKLLTLSSDYYKNEFDNKLNEVEEIEDLYGN